MGTLTKEDRHRLAVRVRLGEKWPAEILQPACYTGHAIVSDAAIQSRWVRFSRWEVYVLGTLVCWSDSPSGWAEELVWEDGTKSPGTGWRYPDTVMVWLES